MCLLAAVQVDDALGVVHDIAGALQFRHDVGGIGGELAQVDGPVLGSGVLLRPPGAVHRLDTEAGVGDGLGEVGAVHLDEMDAGQAVIEENQLFDTVPGLQLHFLGGGVQHMAVPACVPFLGPVGAGRAVCQQDLAELVRLEDTQALGVPENLKGDIGHEGHGPTLIFRDPQSRQLLVDYGGAGFFSGCHGHRLHRVRVRDPALDTGRLPDLPAARGQLVKERHTDAGLFGPGLPGLNMLDLDGDAGEGVAGVAHFLDADGAIGGIGKGHSGNLVILHIGVLGGLLREQVIPGRDLLRHGIMALQGQGDQDRPLRPGGVRAHLAALRVIHREHSPFQRNLGPFLQLHDLQGRLIRCGFSAVGVAADGGQV